MSAQRPTAAGEVPHSFEAWCASILRDGQWLCGLTIDAVSRRCGVKIVVIDERADGSTFPYVFGPAKSRHFPIILYLRDERFQLAKKRVGQTFPKDRGNAPTRMTLPRLQVRGAGKWWSERTPSRHSQSQTSRPIKRSVGSSRKTAFDVEAPPSKGTVRRSNTSGNAVASGGYGGRFWDPRPATGVCLRFRIKGVF